MIGNIQAIEVQIPHEVVQYWGWFLVFGIGLLALGIAAVVRSVLATVATMLFFGWLLVLASGIEIAQAAMNNEDPAAGNGIFVRGDGTPDISSTLAARLLRSHALSSDSWARSLVMYFAAARESGAYGSEKITMVALPVPPKKPETTPEVVATNCLSPSA